MFKDYNINGARFPIDENELLLQENKDTIAKNQPFLDRVSVIDP